MKKYLLFILVLLVPFFVKAESKVKITEVELIEKDDSVEVIEEPTFEGLSIDFNLKFSRPNTSVSYKIKVKNESKKDYEINDGKKYTKGDFVSYSVEVLNNDNVLKAGETKEIELIVEYENAIPIEKFEGRVYNDSNKMAINLSNDEVINPYTSTLPVLLIVISFVALATLLITHSKKKSILFFLLALILIPLTIKALEKLSIDVNANVEIDQPCAKLILQNYGSFSTSEEQKEICAYFDKREEVLSPKDFNFIKPSEFNPETDIDISDQILFHTYNIGPYTFGDESYVRVYSDDTKQNLLLEITKDTFEFIGYDYIKEGEKAYGYPVYDEYGLIFALGNKDDLDPLEIYTEASDDISVIFERWQDYPKVDRSDEGFVGEYVPFIYSLSWAINDDYMLVISKYKESEHIWMDEDSEAKMKVLEEMIYDYSQDAREDGIYYVYEEVEGEYNTYKLTWYVNYPEE